MKKYKVFIRYYMNGGYCKQIVKDYMHPGLTTEHIKQFVESMMAGVINTEFDGLTATAINMSNVSMIEVEFQEWDD